MEMRTILTASATGAALLLLLLASSAAANPNVYVSSSGPTEDLTAFGFGSQGSLVELADSPYDLGSFPQPVAITPDGAHLYTGDYGDAELSGFSVDPADGSLTPLSGFPISFVPSANQFALAFSPDGEHLYVVGQGGNSGLFAFNVAANGSLSPIAGSPFTTGTTPTGLAVTPDGDDLYVGNLGDDTVSGFSIAANGALTELTNSPYPTPGALGTGDGPRALSVTPDGEHLYAANIVSDDVSGFDVEADGDLAPILGSPFSTGDGRGLTISPDGDHLYVPAESADAIIARSITDGTGVLTPVAGSPFNLPASTGPAALAMTPRGGLLYSANLDSDDVRGFDVAATTGALSELASSPYPVGDAPDHQSIVITPDQPPIASFTVAGASTSTTRSFDAGASIDPDSTIARYDWDFGDGATLLDGGPTPVHVYPVHGTYTARVLVTDEIGCSVPSTRTFTGQTAHCNGDPQATTTRQVVIAEVAAPGPTPGPPPPPDPPADTALEGADASAKKTQRQKGSKIKVELEAGAEEAVGVTAEGKVKAGKKSYGLKTTTKDVGAGAKATFKLKPKRSKDAKKVTRVLDDEKKATATLTVTFTDDAGNTDDETLKVKLK